MKTEKAVLVYQDDEPLATVTASNVFFHRKFTLRGEETTELVTISKSLQPVSESKSS